MRRKREAHERRQEERRREREGDELRQDESERRSDELKEAWRRHHPIEPEEGGEGRPKRGHPA
jgi:hypothetical protein